MLVNSIIIWFRQVVSIRMTATVVFGPTEEEVHLGPQPSDLDRWGVDDVIDNVEAPGKEVADPADDQDGHCSAPAEGLLHTVNVCHLHIILHVQGC